MSRIQGSSQATPHARSGVLAHPADGALNAISNGVVRLFKESLGRGPTKARAEFAGPDTLVVVLENTLTVVERNLATWGEHGRLREARLFVQGALEDAARQIVEQALGRRTLAFVTGIDTRNDVATVLFTLSPLTEGGGGAA